ncbi:hypothetical protein O1L60_16605 [Streptomyces diastatochromogenes]|nr:hypothetical protein [Streptomyces diastatochromogenes]
MDGRPWLYVSRASGTLRPGERTTVAVRVDQARAPSAPGARAWA